MLGIAGVRLLRELGYAAIERFHMNEGHSALLAVELLEERLHQLKRTAPVSEDLNRSAVSVCSPPILLFPPHSISFR